MQTERDGQIVEWIGRLGAAGAEHVMSRFAMGRSWAYSRLRSLTADGLLEPRTVLHREPGLYVATNRGLRWRGLGRLPRSGSARVGLSTRASSRAPQSRSTTRFQAGSSSASGRSGSSRAMTASCSRPRRWGNSRTGLGCCTVPTWRSFLVEAGG